MITNYSCHIMKICIECQQKKIKFVFYRICISKMHNDSRYSCVNLSACSRLSVGLKDNNYCGNAHWECNYSESTLFRLCLENRKKKNY